MTLLTLAIAIILVLAISGHQKSSSSSDVATSASASTAVAAKASSASEQDAYDHFRARYNQYNHNGLTVTQKQKLQQMINDESNSAVQSREQTLLDQATVKSAASSSKPAQKPSNASSFGTTHTFSSVNDAQNWAQASKNQWLQAGYTTYTITSDGQGNYNLQFVR